MADLKQGLSKDPKLPSMQMQVPTKEGLSVRGTRQET